MARVADHLSVDDLEARLRSAQDPTATRQVQVIWLLARGHTIADVAAVTSFVPRWIEHLLARYNAHGSEALGDLRRRNGSAPSVLRPELLARLPERLATPPSDGGLTSVRRRPVDRPQSSGLDGQRTRARCGVAPTRLGGPEGDQLVGAEAAPPPSGRGPAGGARDVSKKLAAVVTEEAAKHPDKPVEVWATDEHRMGLKPILRRVWAPKGQRPIALGHHRYKWLYVTAFVQPISGEVFWYVSNGISKPFFAALLALFAREAGAGRERILVLELDNAGWHTEPNLAVPDGIRLVSLPPYSPELQPAEHLWPILDEPLANRSFATLADLERTVADRCRVLEGDQLSLGTNFHWWPKPATPS